MTAREGEPLTTPAPPSTPVSTADTVTRRSTVLGLAAGAIMTLVPVKIALSGSRSDAPATVTAVGMQEVKVSLVNMDIRPEKIEVAAGTRLRLRVTNHDAIRHDLYFPEGPSTRLLAKGQSETLDLGVVVDSRNGWCTVPGHKAAGMTLDIVTKGTSSSAGGSDDSMPAMDHAQAAGSSITAVDPHGQPGASWKPYDSMLAPAPTRKKHVITLRAVEKEIEAAPGVRQRLWTFGGTVPAPALRARVGDDFDITFINDGTIGHGVDFHASAVAPDVAMRTIDPGESLKYRFRADHAGAWLYHCSTMPMLHHIGNGMYGAVIVDPPNLEKADREYLIVSSEYYLGAQGGIADMRKLRTNAWDLAVFNGYPDQYVHAPLVAKVDERVRFWVVAAGPIEGVAFHVVGARFDTVFKEGAYVLRRGNAEHGAAQVLHLSAAQGGFAETVFTEPGRYVLIDHDMRRGETGSRGIVEVTA